MHSTLRAAIAGGLTLIVLGGSVASAADPGIELVGTGTVDGTALDKSGLAGDLCQASSLSTCVPHAILGGFGSDLTWTGHDDVYFAAPDRGPYDGLTDRPYLDRVHALHITTDVDAPFPNITTTLLATRLLRDAEGRSLTGAAGDIDHRFDPEGIRIGPDGTFFLSDEYGPFIAEFDRQGHELRRIAVPGDFAIATASGDPNVELLQNATGRQANRGMEGLAISPDGSTLFGIMQNALLQDNALNPGTTDRISVNTRILKVDLETGDTAEYVYVLDASNRGQGVSELLAINDSEFLVLERDNRSNLQVPPQAPTRKTVYRIDLEGATDVSDITLPAGALPAGIVPVTKAPFLNLLDASYGLAPTIAEKLEALTWGPDLADGRHLLYVISDNDLNPSLDTQLYAFAVDPELVDLERQVLPGPMFPPGQVKKLLR